MAKPRNLQQKLAGAAQRKPRAVSLASAKPAHDHAAIPLDDGPPADAQTTAPAPWRAGTWPITELRPEQCGYIADDSPLLCCGEPAPIGPGNLHGSWCEKHRAVVFDSRSGSDRPLFVRMGRGR